MSRSVIVPCVAINLLLYLIASSLGNSFSCDAFGQQPQQSSALPKITDKSLQVEEVTSGLLLPTSMAFLNNETLLVTQKNNGQVILVSSNGSILNQPAIDVRVNSDSERGLLGIAVVEGTSNHAKSVFLYFTESNGQDPIRNRVYRYEWHPQNQTLINGTLVLDLPAQPGPNHDGGKFEVDRNGNLYTVIGDLNRNGQLQNIPQGGSPDDTSVIFRIRPNGSAVQDNPFFNSTDERMQKYYAYGIRNSFGIAIDPFTGLLWDVENGPDVYDEINVVLPGFNSGWKKVMGPVARANLTQTEIVEELVDFNGSKYADPVFSWKDSIGLTDIEFLNSTALGLEYGFDIFVGDFNNGNLYHFRVNSTRTGIDLNSNLTGLADKVVDDEQELSSIVLGTGFDGGITDIETGPDGLLYVLTFNGSLYRISSVNENAGELEQPMGTAGNIDGDGEAARSSDINDDNLTGVENDSSSDNPLSLLSLSTNEGGSPVLGSLGAPVTVVDFSDFQCSKCARFVKSTEPEIKKEYVDTGKIAFVFKHFPRLGEDSFSAALASECSDEQGKFWEYHDVLFENQQGENTGWANKEKLKEFASQIGLDRTSFDSCLDSNKYSQLVQDDIQFARDLRLTGTPTFVIAFSDGSEPQALVGAHPADTFRKVLNDKLAELET